MGWSAGESSILPTNGLTNERSCEGWLATESIAAYSINRKDLPGKYSFASTSARNPCGALSKKSTLWWRRIALPDTSGSLSITGELTIHRGRPFAQWWSNPSTPSWNSQSPETADYWKAAAGGVGFLGY